MIIRPNFLRAISIVEVLIYVSLLGTLLTLGSKAVGVGSSHARQTQMQTGDINAALRVGEQWRNDIRSAVVSPKLQEIESTPILLIETRDGIIEYRYSDRAVWRRVGGEEEGQKLFDRVESSRMLLYTRGKVSAWRWELELERRDHRSKMRPLFTFIAVPIAP